MFVLEPGKNKKGKERGGYWFKEYNVTSLFMPTGFDQKCYFCILCFFQSDAFVFLAHLFSSSLTRRECLFLSN